MVESKKKTFLEGMTSKQGLKELIELNLGKRKEKHSGEGNYQNWSLGNSIAGSLTFFFKASKCQYGWVLEDRVFPAKELG